ncbi:MAG: signal peptidase II [Bdellovibrionota bacterium]
MVPRKYLILLSTNGLVLALDQITKNAVVARFRLGESLPLVSNFLSLTRVHNVGAAFGLLATLPSNLRDPFFFLVPGLTLAVIFFVFYRLRDNQSISTYALAMIVGGALGNLADRIRLGFVIDFLDFHWKSGWHFPAFNVADSAITLGVMLLLAAMLQEKDTDAPAKVFA